MLHDLLGGSLLLAEVRRNDGSRQGVHRWNRLPGGDEVDLTREQFHPDEHVQAPREVERPPGDPVRAAVEYRLLSDRVRRALGRG